MTVKTIADIVPNGAAIALGATGSKAVWVLLTATGNTCRVGDATVATQGAKLPTGVPVLLPRCSFDQGGYDLGEIKVYATGSDSISVTIGV